MRKELCKGNLPAASPHRTTSASAATSITAAETTASATSITSTSASISSVTYSITAVSTTSTTASSAPTTAATAVTKTFWFRTFTEITLIPPCEVRITAIRVWTPVSNSKTFLTGYYYLTIFTMLIFISLIPKNINTLRRKKKNI